MKKYSLIIQWSEEDNCYMAVCPEFRPVLNMGGPFAHGDTWEEAAREAAIALEGVIESFNDEGQYRLIPEGIFYDPKYEELFKSIMDRHDTLFKNLAKGVTD